MNRNPLFYAVAIGVVAVSLTIVGLVHRADGRRSEVALADAPRPVSAIRATQASFRAQRSYVGTLESWNEANVGPQFIAAYVETVAVRPGAEVKKGQVLATLDCRNARSSSAAVAARARALDAQQQALASQAKRLSELGEHGYVSADDVEQKHAVSVAETEQLSAERAHLSSMALEVEDCVLRAPFDGEVITRSADPGSFVHPGATIVTVSDRSTVRFAADVPENDFDVVASGATVALHIDSIHRDLTGTVKRRTPSADLATRTVHFEVDLENANHELPVNVTGVATLDVGAPIAASQLPVRAAAVQGTRASVYLVDGDVAHAKTVTVLGERGDMLYLDPKALPAGSEVVTEGRSTLGDGEHVAARVEGQLVQK
ncbi:MAG: efflux RND transporter periplasmic adaptor subunit [Kofleriaceae bacterium]